MALIIVVDSIFDKKCGNNPSFFTNVYLHLTFIQCILNDYEGEECPELQFKHDKGMGIEESVGSRVCFCSWLCMILLLLYMCLNFHYLLNSIDI